MSAQSCTNYALKSERILYFGRHVLCTVVESNIQNYFFEHLDEYLPNAKRVIRDDITGCDMRGIPDGWVMWRGCLCPVEVKQRTFGLNGALQLDKYLENYQCKRGIAVAERFWVNKRPNIAYITIPVDRSAEHLAA